jgi:DNA helicase II / ATP-dependent DNA helicase PcrA
MKTYKLNSFSSDSTVNYEEKLNEQQLKVVKEATGPSLVLAGAGSGKTRVLIYRLSYLLQNGIPPQNILLMTFTNRAASEMSNRAEMILKSTLSDLWCGTFHHIGNKTLRKEASVLGYSSNFTIVDREDALGLIEDCLEDLGYYKREKMFPKKSVIYNIYSLAASSLKDSDDIINEFHPHLEDYAYHIKKILSQYKIKKKEANVMDFSDLLTNWLELLKNPSICEKYSQLFQYILVDEYQDTNRLQFEILRLLSSYHNNILVVGDDAQSIYSFRAADINNILDFPRTFVGTKIFKLQINYRSDPPILNLANEIIKHNMHQFPKPLEAIREGGELPCVVETKDVYQQAKFIGQRTLELIHEGTPLNEIAVLFRSRFQALEIEMEFLKRNIPYTIRGGQRFFEQAHIKDVMSYLRAVVNEQDELSFKRAICLHKGIGRGYAYKIWDRLLKQKKSPEEVKKSLPARQKIGFSEFNALFEELKNISSPQKALTRILKNYKDYCYLSFDNPDERVQDLEELIKLSVNYSSIKDFLLDLSSFDEFKGESLNSERRKDEVVVLSTIHQAKGLEWQAVFIIGFCEYEFPHPKAIGSDKALEEERRLLYVAVTRTKCLLYLTYPQTKYTFKSGLIITRPSMFYYELPKGTYDEMRIEQEF